MNRLTQQKKAVRSCVLSLVLAVLLLPVQASFEGYAPFGSAGSIFVSSSVPIPQIKPDISAREGGFLVGFWRSLGFSDDGYKALSSYDSKLYKEVFSAQENKDFTQADNLIEKISDRRLMGHVLAQRYLSAGYKAGSVELKSWMTRYADLPQAQKIYSLASARGSLSLREPVATAQIVPLREPTAQVIRPFDGTPEQKLAAAQDKVKALDAAKWMYEGYSTKALPVAVAAADRSGGAAPQAGWVAGLIYWKNGDYTKAAKYFAQVADSRYAPSWQVSAGAFWAARAYKKIGYEQSAWKYSELASRQNYTFYGMMASYELGLSPKLSWDKPEFTYEREAALLKTQGGQRAFALVAAEQYDLAEAELLSINYDDRNDLKEAAIAYAAHVDLPTVALRLAGHISRENGEHYDAALYPVSAWEPEGGYTVDPSLIHAIIRQESRFEISARSQKGAGGLMQIMPDTARYIAEKGGYADELEHMRPETNLRLGQDYLSYLLKNSDVNGDVVSMLVAYNAGPGNLRKWQARAADAAQTDPLLFIETLPVKETREYVKNVMTNYWIYRDRAGQPLRTLADLSAGKGARYTVGALASN